MGTERTALIFGSSPAKSWDYLKQICPRPELVIAADGGVLCARAAGYTPDLLVGDWDSGGRPEEGIDSVSLPPEKDLTDLQVAMDLAFQRDCHRMLLTACTGGRLDQTLANLGLLEWAYGRGGEALLLDEGNEVRFWDGSPIELPRRDRYRYLSLVPLDKQTGAVTLEGVKYPLNRAVLTRGDTLTVSNEITEKTAKLSGGKSRILVICSQKYHFF